MGPPRWCSGKESAWQCRRHRRHGFNSWVWKISWRRKWQPPLVVLPGKFHGQKQPGGLQSIGLQSQTRLNTCTHTHTYIPLASCTSLNNFFYYPNILIGPLLVLCHVIKTLLFPQSSSNICFTTMT